MPATFTGTKRPRKLIDRARVGSQQSLHQRLGARLQILRRPMRPIDVDGDRIDVRLGQHLGRQHRRVNLDEPLAIKQISQS